MTDTLKEFQKSVIEDIIYGNSSIDDIVDFDCILELAQKNGIDDIASVRKAFSDIINVESEEQLSKLYDKAESMKEEEDDD